jgi:lysozyme
MEGRAPSRPVDRPLRGRLLIVSQFEIRISNFPRYFSQVKSSLRFLFVLSLFPLGAFASNSVVNMSHYDLMRPDFVAMKSEGVVGVIHEASFPKYQRDWRYAERQLQAMRAGLLWGAYHFADGTDPVRQADHFLGVVAASHPLVSGAAQEEKSRPGVLLVLDFESNHYHGGNMTVSQAAAFAQRIKERTGVYPGIYGSENRLRQMFSGVSGGQRAVLSNCWLWVANYHAQPRGIAPWGSWHLWQYTGDGKCGLRPRSAFPVGVANMRKAERNIFNGNNALLQAFWKEHSWVPSG